MQWQMGFRSRFGVFRGGQKLRGKLRGKNLVPKVWGGKFPYQVRVKLVIPKVTDVPKKVLTKLGIDAAVGRFDNCVDDDMADDLVRSLLSPATWGCPRICRKKP